MKHSNSTCYLFSSEKTEIADGIVRQCRQTGRLTIQNFILQRKSNQLGRITGANFT